MINFFGKNPWILFLFATIINTIAIIALAQYYFIFALLLASIFYIFNYEKCVDYLCDEVYNELSHTIFGEIFFVFVFLIMPIWASIILLPLFTKDLDEDLDYDEENYPTN